MVIERRAGYQRRKQSSSLANWPWIRREQAARPAEKRLIKTKDELTAQLVAVIRGKFGRGQAASRREQCVIGALVLEKGL